MRRLASQPDVSNEISATEGHHEGHGEHEGEQSENKTLDAIFSLMLLKLISNPTFTPGEFHVS
jgi:hypothetical protein